MVRQHHQLNGHEFEQNPGDSEGQGGKPDMLQSMGSPIVGHNLVTEQQQHTVGPCGYPFYFSLDI